METGQGSGKLIKKVGQGSWRLVKGHGHWSRVMDVGQGQVDWSRVMEVGQESRTLVKGQWGCQGVVKEVGQGSLEVGQCS